MKTIAELIKQAEKNISFYMVKPTVGPLIGNPLGLMVPFSTAVVPVTEEAARVETIGALENLKEAIRVAQPFVDVEGMYSVVYQNVVLSEGSIFMAE